MFQAKMDGYQKCMTQIKMMFLTKTRWLPKMYDTNKNDVSY